MEGMAASRSSDRAGGGDQALRQHLATENPLRRKGWRSAAKHVRRDAFQVEQRQDSGEGGVGHWFFYILPILFLSY